MPREFDELEFLSNAALALSEIRPDEDIFEFVAQQLTPLAPQSLVMTVSYDPRDGTTTVRAIAGPEDMMTISREVAGEGVGQTYRVDQQARQLLSEGKLVRVEDGMHQLTFRAWPVEVARRLEARLGIRSVHGQPFSRKGDFVGAVAFASRATSLDHARVIEAFVRLAAVAMQRRRAEAQLRESERRFRLLAENSRDVVFRLRVRPTLVFEYVSPAVARLTEHTPDELYADARLALCLLPAEWTEHGPLRELSTEPVVARCRRRDGANLWTELNFTPIRDASGDIVAVEGIARDVTKRKEADDSLLEADRRKTEFLAVLSHELRNPLGSIRNGLYVLGRVEPGGEQAKRAYAVIERQISHLTQLIDDLLDVTRITRGKIRLRKERIELNELVRAQVDDVRSKFVTANVALTLGTPPTDVVVDGDRTRICQIVDNLLENAAKFTPSGGRALVSVLEDPERKHAVIRVHNTDARIAPDIRARLFEPFVQADRTLDRSKGGLGLGLALVKGLVEMHGGSVEVDGNQSEGTTFTVRLPLAAATLDRATLEQVTPESPAESGEPKHRRRVLLIEDNTDAADSLREALELHENSVTVVSSGPEGVAAARALEPDVVLCDIGLPVMNGYEVARAIRADPALRSLPLVALTGYASPEDVAKSLEAGFDRHVGKPPSIDVVERVITELTRRAD